MDARSLRATPSQETLISLLQLEPQPIADTDKELPPLPEESTTTTRSIGLEDTEKLLRSGPSRGTSSLGLSGNNHGSIYYLTRIQRWSTYALSIFTGIHIANTSLIPLATRSVPASESYLLLAREIYQTPLTEPLFIALPIAAHIASGIALRLVRRSQNLKRYGGATPAVFPQKSSTSSTFSSYSLTGPRSPWPTMSLISLAGYGFSVLLAGHVFMNRLLPLHVDGDSSNIGLAYVAHGFARHPATSYLVYGGLLTVGCGHMVWGWATWLGLGPLAGWHTDLKSLGSTRNRDEDARRRKRRRRMWLGVNGAAVIGTLLWAAGGLGVVARGGRMDGWVGKVYDDLYATVGQ
ncbi:DUF1691-domain-containing protein [Cryphonectria parasitica EP155]|uniref:DUF1691-domain-containing protein n=1 Tax=Cryphonectria parasitica (strain ATCC 38755 / EP155) TaxID=660469 RepID=A0A9P5CJ87_CRYP1|nr:DUF1691-domain-containing protein [Cryphonectria parasitica EP155]KAF3759992.1 DUF1691-domain-containing protein [Cryphonectria parasitica EP155]